MPRLVAAVSGCVWLPALVVGHTLKAGSQEGVVRSPCGVGARGQRLRKQGELFSCEKSGVTLGDLFVWLPWGRQWARGGSGDSCNLQVFLRVLQAGDP